MVIGWLEEMPEDADWVESDDGTWDLVECEESLGEEAWGPEAGEYFARADGVF